MFVDRRFLLVCCLFLLCLAPLSAQSPQASAIADTLRKETAGRQLFLHDLAADPHCHLTAHQDAVQFQPTKHHAFLLVTVDSVQPGADAVILRLTGHYLLRTSSTGLASYQAPVPITLELSLPEPLTPESIQQLPDRLFFTYLRSALAAVPPRLQNLVPGFASLSLASVAPNAPTCDCTQLSTPSCPVGTRVLGGVGVRSLVPLQSPVPRLSRVNAHDYATTVLLISSEGSVIDTWTVAASNQEIADESAGTASGLQFRPATCHGTAVPGTLHITLGNPD